MGKRALDSGLPQNDREKSLSYLPRIRYGAGSFLRETPISSNRGNE
jgi:hypothetical protein